MIAALKRCATQKQTQGLKPRESRLGYAALKGRSSTFLYAALKRRSSTKVKRPTLSQKTREGWGNLVDLYSTVAREIPTTSLRAGSSLRLKNGSAQDDARHFL